MVIGDTIFPCKRINKATWVSLDHNTQNQIDHICITKIFTKSVGDVRIRTGADIASDHYLPGGCRDGTEAKEIPDNCTNTITKVQHSLPSTC